MDDAADEIVAKRREPEFTGVVGEQVVAVAPHRDMGVTARAGEVDEGLGHEGGAQAVLFGDRAGHELEERVPVGGHQRAGIGPVHLELAVRVLVVALVGLPAQRQHGLGISEITSYMRISADWS
jgi:hypothetical protein